jgi:hypothetical protein
MQSNYDNKVELAEIGCMRIEIVFQKKKNQAYRSILTGFQTWHHNFSTYFFSEEFCNFGQIIYFPPKPLMCFLNIVILC